MTVTYHVAKTGAGTNPGSAAAPFLTIQQAADIAVAGDTVLVHAGTYREWVKPRHSGLNQNERITYAAAPDEHVTIKGSEVVRGWQKQAGAVWAVTVPNTFFGDYNPFAHAVDGDWLVYPEDRSAHEGDVYLNGHSLFEAHSLDEVAHPQRREKNPFHLYWGLDEKILDADGTVFVWYAQVDNETTTIYANFGPADPNQETVEINVRRSCFTPEAIGRNYITVRGFEICQAATPWAPPTADQLGIIGPHWSKGWIIEDNDIHDSKCSGISLGKEASTGDNDFTKTRRKPGYQYQMEAVFKGLAAGWDKAHVGSHIVRHNHIHDCGQTGIVGHMGCAFSDIYGNDIARIAMKREFWGHEIGGIKFHAALDVQIHDNHIHECTLGTWLDWQTQGTRVARNVYDHNDRDLMVEVSHGPYLVDNNIFASGYNFDNMSEGGAYVNNLCCGAIGLNKVLDRATPYHFAHTTEVLGTQPIYGGDDRWYQNIFVGRNDDRLYGTAGYNGHPTSLAAFIQAYEAKGGDVETYAQLAQPVYIDANVYLHGAKGYDEEQHSVSDAVDPQVKISEEADGLYLTITLPANFTQVPTQQLDTAALGVPRVVEEPFEHPDGTPLTIDRDLTGAALSGKPIPGPIQALQAGPNHIKVMARN